MAGRREVAQRVYLSRYFPHSGSLANRWSSTIACARVFIRTLVVHPDGRFPSHRFPLGSIELWHDVRGVSQLDSQVTVGPGQFVEPDTADNASYSIPTPSLLPVVSVCSRHLAQATI